MMTVLGCAFALASSQIVPLLYLTLGTTIAVDLNAPSLQIWMFSAGLVASGAIAPFVGPIADMFGRKPVFLVGLVVYTLGASKSFPGESSRS
jgi:MFS family permease